MNKDNVGLPKVLIFEHPPINKFGIGVTLYSFFYEWGKERLGQVYSVDLPVDGSLCQYYYLGEFGKREVDTDEVRARREKRRRTFLFKKLADFSHSSFGTLLRHIRFKKVVDNHQDLERWIDDFEPDCIFFGIGENVNENRYVLNVAKSRGVPLIVYVSDDYMSKWRSKKWLSFYGEMLFATYREVMSYSSLTVVISEQMERLYRKYFPDNRYYVARNSAVVKSGISDSSFLNKDTSIIRISYTGNLGLGRWKVIASLSRAIHKYNLLRKGKQLVLDIYSQEKPSNSVLQAITNEYSGYRGSVFGDELDRVRFNSNVLLFVESFENCYRDIISTAFSTKISEYLSYGKTILAVAPEYSSSLAYMRENDVAFCVTDGENLDSCVINLMSFLSSEKRSKYSENAKELFASRHEFFKNALDFKNAVVSVIGLR